jgi:capsular polysaccharide biosynthesis protein
MQEKKSEQGEYTIDLWKLLWAYLGKWWLIVLCGVLGAAVALAYTSYFVTPMYRASVTIYVNTTTTVQQTDTVNSSSLTTAARLVKTYVNILTSDTVLNAVAQSIEETTGQTYSAAAIRARMSASQVDETEMFKVYVTDADPEKAAMIANAVAQEAPNQITEFVVGSSTKIVDYATVPSSFYTPSYSSNTTKGFAVGVVIAVAYISLRVLFDVRLKDEEELVQLFELPVLGRIPSYDHSDSKKKGKYENAYASAADLQASAEKGGRK